MPLDLREIYDSHAQALSAFLFNVTRNEAETRAILRELFSKLATRPERPHGFRQTRGFLIRLAHKLAVHRRASAHDDFFEQGAFEEIRPFAFTSDPDEAGFREALGNVLARLSADQRAIVHLKIWETMSFAEIAAVLEIGPSTAANRYRHALDKLQALLLPLYQEI
ncbi:MAG: sigma-70 family RNA polymerase sigma factor [Verrucomicrobiota bacterium]